MHSLIYALLFLFKLQLYDTKDYKLKNPCIAKRHCDECITSHPNCAWCLQEDYTVDNKPRCDFSYNLVEKGCLHKSIINPENFVKIDTNKPLSLAGTMNNFVQIAPQVMSLKVRPGKPQTFQVKFRQAEDYPIDLYYLMDLSNSMEDDKEKLASLGDLLANSMRNITSNFRVGFGSFVDKVVMPYVSIVPEKLRQPCDRCAAPYSFKNHLSLTSDTYRFSEEIRMAPVSGNLDAPEGGLDAIMQAIACRQEIGWRPEARNLLILSTDASFHFAGDGKLGGIVTPNDGQCHLDSNGYYTHGIIQDYPSVSQIIHKIREKSVNVIFAITGEQLAIYQKFSRILEGSTVGQLANDSSNIVELVKDNYNKITSRIEIKEISLPNVTVTYESSCLNFGSKKKKTKVCEGLKVGDTVTFDVTVTLDSCSGSVDEDKGRELKINAIGFGEQLTLKIESICGCACSKPPYAKENSAECSNGHGTYECGSCRCHENRFGRNCECDSSAHLLSSPFATFESNQYSPALRGGPSSSSGTFTMNDLCVKSRKLRLSSGAINGSSTNLIGDRVNYDYKEITAYNTNTQQLDIYDFNEDYLEEPICSGRGDCVCGICECWPRENVNEAVGGEFCECDNFSCDRFENKVCGGRERGRCECGGCICAEGWTGDACQCPSSNISCIASNGKICNGVGVCDCGVCICDAYEGASPSGFVVSDSNNRYRGPTCEECPTCPGLCSENRACVQCLVFKTGPLYEDGNEGGLEPTTTFTNSSTRSSSSAVMFQQPSGEGIEKLACKRQCASIEPIVVEDLLNEEVTTATSTNETLCQFKDDDDCTFYFTYSYDLNRNLILKVQKTKVCPTYPSLLPMILPIIAGIIMIGLIFLVVWKLVTYLHDTREFAKFERDKENAKWDSGENPIFKQATSTYKNPMFRKDR